MTLLFAAQLFFAIIFLGLTGLLIKHSLGGLWFSCNRGSYFAHYVFLGQLTYFVIVYIRSFINHVVGFIVPISLMDFFLFAGGLAFFLYKKDRLKSVFNEISQFKYNYIVTAIFVYILLSVISYRELPRLVMLSSDPDQHMFMAKQILRFRTIPFTQFYWGPENFGYPAGFAVLNFIWSNLTFMDVRNVVTAQVLVQIQIGILLLLECVWVEHRDLFRKNMHYGAALFIAFLIYYFFLPYGYQRSNYHLEGTARVGSLFFMTIGISFLYFQFINWKNTEYGKNFNLPLNTSVISLVLASAFLLNPINLFHLSCLFLISIILFFIRYGNWQKVYQLFIGIPFLLFIFLDPYIIDSFISGKQDDLLIHTHAMDVKLLAKEYYAILINKITSGITYLDFLDVDLLSKNGSAILVLLILSICILIASSKYLKRYHLAIIFLTPLILMIIYIPFSALMQTLSSRGGYLYLLNPYFNFYSRQFLFLWVFSVLGLLISFIIYHVKLRYAAVGFLIIIACLGQISKMEGKVKTLPRKNYWGSMGYVAKDDLWVIKSIEKMFNDYCKEKKYLSYENIPKILVANSLMDFGREKWLFPNGASRILPLYDVFPLAFYYGHGDREYTFNTYKEKICQTLDKKWLKERNIKYLFLPTSRYKECVYNLESLISNRNVIFRKNRAMFIQLYDTPGKQ